MADLISKLRKLVHRQEEDEVRPIYGSGPYRLSAQYPKFLMDSMKWHSLDAEKRRKHVSLFQQHMSAIEKEFKKPQKSGEKANEKQRKRKETPEIFVERVQKDEKRTSIDDPNVQPQVPYVLFFWSLVPRLFQRCQGNCSINLKSSDNEDYLVVKSHGSTITVNGEEKTRSGLKYVHFNNVCLKEYAYLKHNACYDQFLLKLVAIDKDTLQRLTHEERTYLTNFWVTTFDE